MKIGIITWFTGPNYGTNLQAIALQYYLRRQGHETKIINYEVSPPNAVKRKKNIFSRIAYQPKKFAIKYAMNKYKDSIIERDNKLTSAIKEKCLLTPKIDDVEHLIRICNTFDLIICGSDQIWNPNWYNRFYFADYDEIKTRRISYAASMGVNGIPTNLVSEIKRSLSKFDLISVRESKAADILEQVNNDRPDIVVDPTLLLSKDEWDELFKRKNTEKEKFILAFFLSDNPRHLKATKKFAKKNSLKFILIPYNGMTYLQNADIRSNVGLEDLFDLIRNAEYVITDSFHITVFSIIYNKQFFTFQRFMENEYTSQNVRVTNLLKIANLTDRLIPYSSNKIENHEFIHYENIDLKLSSEIEKSKEFIKKAIENKSK